MKFLNEVVSLVDQKEFGLEIKRSSKLQQLFDLMANRQVTSYKEGAVILYGTHEKRAAFKELAGRLEQKLINYVLRNGIKHRKTDALLVGIRECLVSAAVVRILIMGTARKASVLLAEKTIRRSIKYELTETTVYLARELHYYFSTLSLNPSKEKHYKQLLSKYSEILQKEIRAHECFCEIRRENLLSVGSLKKKLLAKTELYKKELEQYLNDEDKLSYKMLVDIYNIIVMHYEVKQDYNRIIITCESAIDYFRRRNPDRRTIYYQFDLYKIESYIQLQEYSKVNEIFNRYNYILIQGSVNWYVLRIYMLVNALHSKAYNRAVEILKELKETSWNEELPVHLREIIHVYQAHMIFLSVSGRTRVKLKGDFRLNKFLNEIPHYSKDKRGLNIAILIIQFLFLLQKRKYPQIIDKVDALKQYCYRYLRKDDTFRSHCFIRMLLQIPRADFNRIRTERYAEPYIKKLRSVPIRVSEQSIEVEVIPYEDLWEMTVEMLN